MPFGILGTLDLRTGDGTPVDPGGPRPRALVSLLLREAGHGVSVERLTGGPYGAAPPSGAGNALRSQISRLRRRLAPHAETEATAAGYRLAVVPDAVDVHRFERLTGPAGGPLSPPGTLPGRPPCRARPSSSGAARPCPTSPTRTPSGPGSASCG
ncbi:hypothetical protein J2X68_004293 [Streptomyces sp. 3330]|nr:hypothetical protein [Streptomyces sp. 3330]